MSIENIQLFYKKTEQDENLKEKLIHLFNEEHTVFMDNLVELGKASGFEFTKDEFQHLIKDVNTIDFAGEKELNDDQLEAVSGGIVTGLIVTAGFGLVVTAGVGMTIGAVIYTKTVDNSW